MTDERNNQSLERLYNEKRGPILMLSTDKNQRKECPIARGVLDYFPDAIAEVANVSYIGNQQHNPGQELHWDRRKSLDHADCIARHLVDRGMTDTDGMRHSAKVAWRALAMLQIELEEEAKYAPEPGGLMAIDPALLSKVNLAEHTHKPTLTSDQVIMLTQLREFGCDERVAGLIAAGTTFPLYLNGYVYLAGPMRGYENFNFPAFDAARDRFTKKGFAVISPADIDRAAEDKDNPDAQADFFYRDMYSLLFLKKEGTPTNSIVMLDMWERSTGARAELMAALWLGLRVRNDSKKQKFSVRGPELLYGLHDSLMKGN